MESIDPGDFFLLGFYALIGLSGFIYGFRFFIRARVIENTPTAKAASTAQGYTELIGHGRSMPGEPILAQLSKRPVLWYKYRMSDNGTVTAKGQSHGIFYIEDASGYCIVDPDDAEIFGADKRFWTESNERAMEEWIVPIGTVLYVIGEVHQSDYYAHMLSIEDEVGEKVADWKRNYPRLLERFDKNKDGEICMAEWQEVLKAAEKEVIAERGERIKAPSVAYITKPKLSKNPYIIATYPPDVLVKKLRVYSYLCFIGFFIAGCLFLDYLFQSPW